MVSTVDFEKAKSILGDRIIGIDDLKKIDVINFDYSNYSNTIPFPLEVIEQRAKDWYLIYGVSKFLDGKNVSIRNLKNIFGENPAINEPCFYFQNWYDNEEFIDNSMSEGWFWVRKSVYEDSRAVDPNELLKKYSFPDAITCTYAFFVTWLTKTDKLWYHDFVWCEDVDHNGDRIYVGKYNDVDGVNVNGFSIHRHLALRNCYGCIE